MSGGRFLVLETLCYIIGFKIEPVPYWLDKPLMPLLVHAKLVTSMIISHVCFGGYSLRLDLQFPFSITIVEWIQPVFHALKTPRLHPKPAVPQKTCLRPRPSVEANRVASFVFR
jgi:hypothetical protein